jgi:hypothetical protein
MWTECYRFVTTLYFFCDFFNLLSDIASVGVLARCRQFGPIISRAFRPGFLLERKLRFELKLASCIHDIEDIQLA